MCLRRSVLCFFSFIKCVYKLLRWIVLDVAQRYLRRTESGAMDRVRGSGKTYRGLQNQGATCYLNSVLQVLFMTKEFRNALKRKSPGAECIDHLLLSIFKALEKKTAHTYAITQKLGIKAHEQHDAAAYLEKILIHTSPEAAQIFQGRLTPVNKCSKCEKETGAEEPFWSLPLALLDCDNEPYKVMDGIQKFFGPTHYSGDNQMYCDHCEAKADATVKFKMTYYPEVLTLLLKRFKFDYRHMEYMKLKCKVNIPDTLEIFQTETYELYAFVEHSGHLSGGHYTATIKSQDDGKWYNFNDSFVSRCAYQPFQVDDNMLSRGAYLLFYRKKKPHTADADSCQVSMPGASSLDTSEGGEQCGRGGKTKKRKDGEGDRKESVANKLPGKVVKFFSKNKEKPANNSNAKEDPGGKIGKQKQKPNQHVGKERDEGKMTTSVKAEDQKGAKTNERKKAGGGGKPLSENPSQNSEAVGSKKDTSRNSQKHKQEVGERRDNRKGKQSKQEGLEKEMRPEDVAEDGKTRETKHDGNRENQSRDAQYKNPGEIQKGPMSEGCSVEEGQLTRSGVQSSIEAAGTEEREEEANTEGESDPNRVKLNDSSVPEPQVDGDKNLTGEVEKSSEEKSSSESNAEMTAKDSDAQVPAESGQEGAAEKKKRRRHRGGKKKKKDVL